MYRAGSSRSFAGRASYDTVCAACTMRTKGVLLLSSLMLKRLGPKPKSDMLSYLLGTTPDSRPCLADKGGLQNAMHVHLLEAQKDCSTSKQVKRKTSNVQASQNGIAKRCVQYIT